MGQLCVEEMDFQLDERGTHYNIVASNAYCVVTNFLLSDQSPLHISSAFAFNRRYALCRTHFVDNIKIRECLSIEFDLAIGFS
jgi:hypothetical protein